MSQVSHLDKQVYPGDNGLLTAACHDATSSRAHSYMVINFNLSTPEKFRPRNTLFPDEAFRRQSPMDPPLRPDKRGVIAGRGPPQGGYLLPRGGHKDCPAQLGLHSPGRTLHGSRELYSRSQLPAHRSLSLPAAAVAGSEQHRCHHGCSYSQETAPSPCPPTSPGCDPLQPL